MFKKQNQNTMLKPNPILVFSAIAALAASLHTAGAADKKKVDVSKLPPPSDKQGLTYDKDIKPILESSCLKCHGAEKPKAKYRVDSREALIKGGESEEAAVIPGKSDNSPMVWFVADLVEDMEMPPLDKREKYPALKKEQVGVIRAWIDQGAK